MKKRKLNILVIAAQPPVPTNSGARIVVFNRIFELVNLGHCVHLVVFKTYEKDLQYEMELKKICKSVHIFSKKNLILTLLSRPDLPFSVNRRRLSFLFKVVHNIIQNNKIDIVIAEELPVIQYVLKLKSQNVKKIYSVHNIESITWKNYALSLPNYLMKLVFFIDAIRVAFYEKRIFKCPFMSSYIFLSNKEKKYFEFNFYCQRKKSFLSPVGFSYNRVDEEVKFRSNADKLIVFGGSLDYPPNVEGACWFSNKILPRILREVDGVKFIIVGKKPVQEVVKLSSQNIMVIGDVKSLVPYYQIASLIVIPLLRGTGVKVKLLETLGLGKIIVSTTVGIEGTNFIHRKHLLIADDERSFAQSCIEVLKNPHRFRGIGLKAKKFVRENFAWRKIVNELEAYYYKTLETSEHPGVCS